MTPPIGPVDCVGSHDVPYTLAILSTNPYASRLIDGEAGKFPIFRALRGRVSHVRRGKNHSHSIIARTT